MQYIGSKIIPVSKRAKYSNNGEWPNEPKTVKKRFKTHAQINMKMGNSTPCNIVTPENFILKLCTRDYVIEVTHQANCGFNRYNRASTQISVPFFDCSVRTARPIFALYRSNDVFPRKVGPK